MLFWVDFFLPRLRLFRAIKTWSGFSFGASAGYNCRRSPRRIVPDLNKSAFDDPFQGNGLLRFNFGGGESGEECRQGSSKTI
jgi:hypothetical protein